jgi:hypothetical protein
MRSPEGCRDDKTLTKVGLHGPITRSTKEEVVAVGTAAASASTTLHRAVLAALVRLLAEEKLGRTLPMCAGWCDHRLKRGGVS